MRFMPDRPAVARACAIALCLWLGVVVMTGTAGCAAGRGPGGEVVVGWDVASLPETAEQSAAALANWILPGLGTAGAGILGAIGLAIRNGTARRRAEVEAAKLAGANQGWDERGSVAVPLPAVQPAPAGPAPDARSHS